MKILGVGSGGREHALTLKLAASSHEPKVFWVSDVKNPGILNACRATGGELVVGSTVDPSFVAGCAERFAVDLVFVGPEEPNFHGVPDELEKRGIPCIGANRAVALIEFSKAEMRRLQWRYDIPGKLLFKTFRSADEAYETLHKYSDTLTWLQNVALKPARQAGGKGVKVIEDRQIYLHGEKQQFKSKHVDWLQGYMKSYSDIDDKILIEENVWGPEYTLHCFTDGRSVVGMPLVQDNKNAHEFDIGAETGGMGSISGPKMTLPFLTEKEYAESLAVVRKMVDSIQSKTGCRYHGVVAGQMMLTEIEGPTIIEMYSRLGDPEALNVLQMLETDLVDICEAIVDDRLEGVKVRFREEAVVVKAVAPNGYPDFREMAKGHPVQLDEDGIRGKGCSVFWGSADLGEDGVIRTGGSRVVELMASADELPAASERIEECVRGVRLADGWGLFHRSDIGSRELLERRSRLAAKVRQLYSYRKEKGIVGRRIDWLPGVGIIDPVAALKEEVLKRSEQP